MKKLPTISKIGEAVLLRIFKPRSVCSALEQTEVDVYFPKEKIDLLPRCDVYTGKKHFGNVQSTYGQLYYIWGMEQGLHLLPFTEDDNLLSGIVRVISKQTRSVSPSHVISCVWQNNDVTGSSHKYTVYRLTQEQEQEIYSCVLVKIQESERMKDILLS